MFSVRELVKTRPPTLFDEHSTEYTVYKELPLADQFAGALSLDTPVNGWGEGVLQSVDVEPKVSQAVNILLLFAAFTLK